MLIGIPRETRTGETRVAATPETVKKLAASGKHDIVVEAGAGTASSIPDDAYVAAGIGRFEWKDEDDLLLSFRGGPLHTMQAMNAVFPHMRAQQWGRIDHRGAGSSRVTCGKRACAVTGSSGTLTYSPRRNSSAWSRNAALPGTPSWPPSRTR